MGDGSGDFQRVWHEHVGSMFEGVTILDVGAGHGRSKARLENGGKNTVTTQDIRRELMQLVDVISDLRDVHGRWGVVTAFDVIEHASDPEFLLDLMRERARRCVVFTTPNRLVSPAPWHFYAHEVEAMAMALKPDSARWFVRRKDDTGDRIEEVERRQFLAADEAHAFGVCVSLEATP